MVTRKEFVTLVVDELQKNPKGVLRGHGMNASLLNELSQRQDVLAKLASIAYSTVNATRGTKSLVKQDNFQIFAYKNFNVLNGKARQDAEMFASRLSDADQAEFDNNENCLTIAMLPDNGDAGSSDNISYGKSATLKFDSSVSKEYKMPDASYIVIMWGDSAIRKTEKTKAEAKATQNERIVERTKTPQKIKAKLVANAKIKLTKLNKSNFKLNNKVAIEKRALSEFDRYGKELGLGKGASAADINAAQRAFNSRTTLGAGALKDARKEELGREINTIRMNNRVLRQKAASAQTAKARADINFAIRTNNTKIKSIENAINVYNDTSARTISKRQAYLNSIQAKIAANLAKKDSITAATQKAIASLNLPVQQKAEIAQQIIEEIANGQQMSVAVQHVLEDKITEEIAAQQVIDTPVQQIVPPVTPKRGRTKKEFFIDQNATVDVMGDDFVDAPFTDEEVEMAELPFLSRTGKKLKDLMSKL